MSDARRLRICLVAIVAAVVPALAAVAAVCGDPAPETVSEPPAGVSYTPQGHIARLRLEVVDDTITCDGGKQELRVWLDDLPREPTIDPKSAARAIDQGLPTPEPSTTGVIAYQFRLRYDPAVVWVANSADVEVPPELDQSGPDTNIDRNFTATARLDNHAGELFAGGLALGLAAGMDPGNVGPRGVAFAPGIDPVAAGRPLLIMSISLTPIGEGRSPLSLADVELLTDYNYRMMPVETVEADSVVDGGECEKLMTPTPLSTQTPIVVIPTQTPAVITIPTTPQPAEGVRDDCPAGWAVADEADFSLCYPADLRAVRLSTGGTRVAYNVASPPPPAGEAPLNQIFVSVARQAGRSFSPEVECRNVTVIPVLTRIEPVQMVIDGRSFTGCLSHGTDSAAGRVFEMQAYLVDIELADGEYIAIVATNTGPLLLETRQAVEAILQTVRTK